jgi:hypothetical protein
MPVHTNFYGAVVQLVRMLACHARGRGFKSRPLRHLIGGIAQLGEHGLCKAGVIGSNPIASTN